MFFFFLMLRLPPRSTRTDTLFPYTTLFRSPPLAAHFDFTVFAPVERLRPCQPQRAGKGPHHGEKSAVLKDFIGLGGPQIDEGRSLMAIDYDNLINWRIADVHQVYSDRDKRSEERRVGKECGSTCRFWGSAYN